MSRNFAAALLTLLGTSLVASLLAAEPAPPAPVALPEHAFLKNFVGTWEGTNECKLGPDDTTKCQASLTARLLGEHWMVADVTCSMPEGKMTGLLTVGYDPAKKKYVGTWVDSAFNHLWKYEGEVDKSGKKLSLYAEGPNFMAEGKTAKFVDIYEFVSADEVHATSKMQMEDGTWFTMMTGVSKRVKK